MPMNARAERRLSITRNIVLCAVYSNLQHQVVARAPLSRVAEIIAAKRAVIA